jgi:hypothetical protein
LIFATLLSIERIISADLMREALPYLEKSVAPEVSLTFHKFAMLCCILQHDYPGHPVENNLPI